MTLALLLLQDPARYAEVLEKIRKGTDFEATHQAILKLGASEHVKALAASYRKAVYCGECRNGKVSCADCGGKGRRDLPCPKCGGAGRHKPESGVVGSADVSVKCRNCDGLKVFRNAGCPGCARTGLAPCGACVGSPWRDRHCARKDCRLGRVPCPDCEGKGKVHPPCGLCSGAGRVQASGAAAGADVSVKCRGCEGKGRSSLEQPCATCAGRPEGVGRVRCEGKGFTLNVEDVFMTEPCPPCAACFNLGVKILPR